MPACREEMARHARLADELRLPVFQWYTPLWAAVEAMLARRLRRRPSGWPPRRGRRACARAIATPTLFADMVVFSVQIQRGEFDQVDLAFIEDKMATSAAGPAYACSYAWVLAGRGEADRARRALDARDRPRARLRRQLAVRARPSARRRASRSATATHAAGLYDRLAALRRPPGHRGPRGHQLRRRRPPPRRPGRPARPPRRRRAPPARRDRPQRRARLHRVAAHAQRALREVDAPDARQ